MKEIKSILLVVDMEGCTGVFASNNLETNIKLMNEEVDAIIRNFHTAYKISVLDCHAKGTNLLPLIVKYPDIEFIFHYWSFNPNKKYDCALFIGFHAKNGTEGVMSHTFRDTIACVCLDRKEVGELEIFINWLAYYNIPTVFVGGDLAAINEISHFKFDKFITKTLNEQCESIGVLCHDNLCTAITSALKKEPPRCAYNTSAIKLKLKNNDYLQFIPNKEYPKQKNYLVFENTLEFLEKLYELCFLFMALDKITLMRNNKVLQKLKEKISFEDIQNSDDAMLKRIFSLESRLYINKKHRKYIIEKFKL